MKQPPGGGDKAVERRPAGKLGRQLSPYGVERFARLCRIPCGRIHVISPADHFALHPLVRFTHRRVIHVFPDIFPSKVPDDQLFVNHPSVALQQRAVPVQPTLKEVDAFELFDDHVVKGPCVGVFQWPGSIHPVVKTFVDKLLEGSERDDRVLPGGGDCVETPGKCLLKEVDEQE